MKKHLTLLSVICCLIIISCSSTRLTSSWSLPGATVHKYSKVLVLGLAGNKDRDIREHIESSMVKKLKEFGINAFPASDKYSPQAFHGLNDDDAIKMVKNDGFDGIVILALLDKNQEKYYTPGNITRTPYAVVRSRWTRHYRILYDRVYTPGYFTTSTNYELEANFYDVNTNELQYSAQAKSFDPGSVVGLGDDFSKSVVDDMFKKGLLAK
jgi:hypothetical protein